jgi:hypothetical protein
MPVQFFTGLNVSNGDRLIVKKEFADLIYDTNRWFLKVVKQTTKESLYGSYEHISASKKKAKRVSIHGVNVCNGSMADKPNRFNKGLW